MLKNLPLYCPKRSRETLINANMSVIKELDVQMQSRQLRIRKSKAIGSFHQPNTGHRINIFLDRSPEMVTLGKAVKGQDECFAPPTVFPAFAVWQIGGHKQTDCLCPLSISWVPWCRAYIKGLKSLDLCGFSSVKTRG